MKALKLIILTALVFGFTNCKFLRDKGIFGGGIDSKTKDYITKLENTIQLDSMKYAAQFEKLQKEAKAKIDSLEKSCGGSSGNYHIITGSFLNPLNAVSFNTEMSKLGYKSQIVDASNGFKLVSAYSANSYSEVANQLSAIRTSVNPDSWVYVK